MSLKTIADTIQLIEKELGDVVVTIRNDPMHYGIIFRIFWMDGSELNYQRLIPLRYIGDGPTEEYMINELIAHAKHEKEKYGETLRTPKQS